MLNEGAVRYIDKFELQFIFISFDSNFTAFAIGCKIPIIRILFGPFRNKEL